MYFGTTIWWNLYYTYFEYEVVEAYTAFFLVSAVFYKGCVTIKLLEYLCAHVVKTHGPMLL